MKHRNNGGFSLVEMLVAIVILGLITVPMLSGMVVAMKTIARSEEMMKAQLAVSSAVETLMADGVVHESTAYRAEDFPNVTILTEFGDGTTDYFDVTITSKDDETVFVKTAIRKAGVGIS